MGNAIDEKFVQDNICMPSTPLNGLVCGRSRVLSDGDLLMKVSNLSQDIFGEVESALENSGTQIRESDCMEIKEMPPGDALEVKSVVGEVACSKDESYKIQTKQSLHFVVVGLSSPAFAPSTPINQNIRKRHNSTPVKQNPGKKHSRSTDKPDQKAKLKKNRPKISNVEDNNKCSFNIQSEDATKSFKRALKFDLENTAGDGCNQFKNEDNQAANVDLVKKVEKQCLLPLHCKISKINQRLIDCRKSVPNFQQMPKKRRTRRLVHMVGSSCRTVKTAEVGISGKGMNLNSKLGGSTEENQAAVESVDMYSAVKLKRRRLAGNSQRPLINVNSFPKEDLSQLHISEGDFTINYGRVGPADKEKGNKRRWRKLQLSGENHGAVGLKDQNAVSLVELNKKHKFRAKVDLDEESERVYNLLKSIGGNIFDQEAEADSEKKEYWDRERNITRIRVESFISTIDMIQGDRSFSPWKGSVVDSVVGAFLTQNVCDHYSSSAFMSLAARFPNHKLNGKSKSLEPESRDLQPSGGKTAPCAKRGPEFKDEEMKEPSTTCDNLRKKQITSRERDDKTMDIVDWEAVRQANVDEVAEIIKDRGMNNVIAAKIKDFLNKIVEDHGSPDLEWLRDIPPEEAKNYLLNIFGMGLKSVECICLLTLHHVAFPVDTNVRRVAVRLGWVPLKPLPEGLQMHLLEMYPMANSIQKYLYPRLCTLGQEKLYLLHYHLITFGKVFCTKEKPNCNACPMRGECKYFASAFASHRLDLPSPGRKDIATTQNLVLKTTPLVLESDHDVSDPEFQRKNSKLGSQHLRQKCEPIIEYPDSSEPSEPEDIEDLFKDYDPEFKRKNSKLGSQHLRQRCEPIIEYPDSSEPSEPEDIEDLFKDSDELNGFGNYDDDDIPIIRIDNEACMKNILAHTKRNNISFQGDMSKILAFLNSSAPLPMPPLKHVGRLRTVHQVYVLPDDHPILDDVDKRDPDDPSPYLFAVWNEGKDRSSISQTSSSGKQVRYNIVCNCSEPDCKSLVWGTLLIPVRSANHGTFPLNGTYFQVNEVFADDESTQRPIVVARDWLWGLTRRNLYCGTSPTSTFKGFTLYHIQHALCKGFFCNRGFNRKTRQTTILGHRFHINTVYPKKRATSHAVKSNRHA